MSGNGVLKLSKPVKLKNCRGFTPVPFGGLTTAQTPSCKGPSAKYDQFLRVTMEKNNEIAKNENCKKSHINPYSSLMKDIIGIW